jgi:uncharacterized membrane protein
MSALRRALIDGAMVVLPLGAILLLVLGIVHKLQQAADPLARHYAHPAVAAVALLVLLCLLVGVLVRSAAGLWLRRMLEGTLFDRMPGYRLIKAFSGDGPRSQGGARAMRPALAAFDDGQCPALVMDELADGRLLVFVPGSPAPMSGTLYVFAAERVRFLDVPLLPFLKAISSWGLGLREIIEAAAPPAAP